MKGVRILATCVALLAIASAVQAAPITIVNPSFEDPIQADGVFTNKIATGWAVDAGGTNAWGVKNPVATEITGAAGNNLLDPVGGEGINYLYLNSGQTSQVLAATLQNNTQYDLTVAVARRLETSRLDVNDYYIRLLAGNTVIAELVNGDTTLLTAGVFTDQTISYTSSANDPLAGQALKIVLGRVGAHVSTRLGMDKVRLNATEIPEPATLSLLGLGLLGILRRKK